MKFALFTAALSLSASNAVMAAELPGALFTGFFTDEQAIEHAFGIVVPLGGAHSIDVGSRHRLELRAASLQRSVARLIGPEGDVLHESETIGPIAERPSFAYQVCHGTVTFLSPAPAPERVLGC